MPKNQIKSEEFLYDVIAYPSFVFAQSHPDRLAVTAKLYGMNPAPIEKCRVLELGCSTGTNINWLAYSLPESEFVGVDLAENHIIEADKNKELLGLRNASFFRQDVLEMTKKAYGKFDYIIAHGLFSWVPDFVREKVLSLYDELLNPEGVGFISYNLFPGFYRRQIVRDIMRFHTRDIENPLEKVAEGVDFIGFLTEHTVSPVFRELLTYELGSLKERPLENIFHDDFAEINQPFYFTEFVAAAEKHNLQFLSESEYFAAQKDNLGGEAAEVFESISENLIEYEQYSDFLESRRFRQTLLCKKEAILEQEINPLKLREFYISSELKPTSPAIDLNPEAAKEFISDDGNEVEISHNLTKVVLANLVAFGAHPVKFDELIERADGILRSQGIAYENLAEESEITASLLLQLYSPKAIKFHTCRLNVVDYVSEKPKVSEFALWQLTQGEIATNVYGGSLNFQDYLLRLLLNLLDGTRNREDLIRELSEIINADEEIETKEAILANLPETLNQDLFVLAKTGFLIG